VGSPVSGKPKTHGEHVIELENPTNFWASLLLGEDAYLLERISTLSLPPMLA
jgi:hypothetical protein